MTLNKYADRWKRCAKKWRSIVKQVDAECMFAHTNEILAKQRVRALEKALHEVHEITSKQDCPEAAGSRKGTCEMCKVGKIINTALGR